MYTIGLNKCVYHFCYTHIKVPTKELKARQPYDMNRPQEKKTT